MHGIRLLAIALVVSIGLLAPSPARAQSEPYIGQLMLTAALYCPNGWAEADGQIVSISQNTALFSLLGTTYGGDGVTTFALPDLRGRAPIHTGTGTGLTPRTLGEQLGTESVTLLQGQMPAHGHALLGTTDGADAASPTGAALATKARTTLYRAGATPNTTLHGGSIAAAGGSQPHDNMPPVLVMRWCVALTGIFPTHSFAPADATATRVKRVQPRRFGR